MRSDKVKFFGKEGESLPIFKSSLTPFQQRKRTGNLTSKRRLAA